QSRSKFLSHLPDSKRRSPSPFPDAAERLRIRPPACIARPAPEANRTLVLLGAGIELPGNTSSDAGQCSYPTRENPQQDALRPSSEAVATIPFAPESHPVTVRQAGPRVPLATEQFFDALPFQESSAHQSRLALPAPLSAVLGRDGPDHQSLRTGTSASPRQSCPRPFASGRGRNGTQCADKEYPCPP